MGVSKTSDHIQIKIKMPNPSQERPASSKAPNEDLKDMDVLCTFKIKIESQNLDHGYIKDQGPYPNQDQDAKPKSGTTSILQSPKWGVKWHGCSLHLQNQNREQKFGSWVYQRIVTIYKSKLRCLTWLKNLQHPPKSQMRTWCSLHLQNQNREPKFWSWVYQRPVTISKQDQDAKPHSGPSSILQSPKWGLKGHDVRCTFKIKIVSQNLD